ncbi:MAG: TA0938 family protein [Thaumarchaeota archaeon]|nr:TA0938 family protein [Nitrososphaerota archaeon]
MKPPTAGCALCGATWGDDWEEVDGSRLFFCCEVCAKQYRGIVGEAKRRKGWAAVDKVEMQGDFRGRVCTVRYGPETNKFLISFFEDGELRTFAELG